jgi:hypothetical protein
MLSSSSVFDLKTGIWLFCLWPQFPVDTDRQLSSFDALVSISIFRYDNIKGMLTSKSK